MNEGTAITLVAVLVIIGSVALLFRILSLRHLERMRILEKHGDLGLLNPPNQKRKFALKMALTFLGISLGFCFSLVLFALIPALKMPLPFFIGLPLGVGLGFLGHYFVEGRDES